MSKPEKIANHESFIHLTAEICKNTDGTINRKCQNSFIEDGVSSGKVSPAIVNLVFSENDNASGIPPASIEKFSPYLDRKSEDWTADTWADAQGWPEDDSRRETLTEEVDKYMVKANKLFHMTTSLADSTRSFVTQSLAEESMTSDELWDEVVLSQYRVITSPDGLGLELPLPIQHIDTYVGRDGKITNMQYEDADLEYIIRGLYETHSEDLQRDLNARMKKGDISQDEINEMGESIDILEGGSQSIKIREGGREKQTLNRYPFLYPSKDGKGLSWYYVDEDNLDNINKGSIDMSANLGPQYLITWNQLQEGLRNRYLFNLYGDILQASSTVLSESDPLLLMKEWMEEYEDRTVEKPRRVGLNKPFGSGILGVEEYPDSLLGFFAQLWTDHLSPMNNFARFLTGNEDPVIAQFGERGYEWVELRNSIDAIFTGTRIGKLEYDALSEHFGDGFNEEEPVSSTNLPNPLTSTPEQKRKAIKVLQGEYNKYRTDFQSWNKFIRNGLRGTTRVMKSVSETAAKAHDRYLKQLEITPSNPWLPSETHMGQNVP